MTDLISRLRALDACAVSDALDTRGISGVAAGLVSLSLRRRIAGRAITVRLGSADGRPPARHLCSAAVEAADADTIIVIDHGGRTDVAGWGGILSQGAIRRKAAGVVIDGAARDIDESREVGLPLYGRAGIPRTARGRIVEKDWGVTVTICGVEVSPDDLVIADSSGVVFIPNGRAAEIIDVAERIMRKESMMVADVRDGQPVSLVMSKSYEAMLQEIRS